MHLFIPGQHWFITEEATLYKDSEPSACTEHLVLALLSWPGALCMVLWSGYMLLVGSVCLCGSGKAFTCSTVFTPISLNRVRRTLYCLVGNTGIQVELLELLYWILLVLSFFTNLYISENRLADVSCKAPVIMSDRRKKIRWLWLIEDKDSKT